VIKRRVLPKTLTPTLRVLLANGFERKDDAEGRAETVVVFQKHNVFVQLARAGEDEGIRSPWTWVLWNTDNKEYKSGQGAVALRKALEP